MNVEQLFSEFQKKKVLVVGDVIIDSYIYGTQKTSDAVPVISAKRKEKRLGGAANVALNIQALGATAILCSVVGDDHDGQVFEQLLKSQGLPNEGIIRSQNRRTTTKLRVLDGHQQMIRVDSEDIHPLEALDRKSLLNHITNLAQQADLIIFEDYDKGTIHSEVISETISIAEVQGIPVAADPRSTNFFSYQRPTLFKPTPSDLKDHFGENLQLDSEGQIRKLIEQLDEKIKANSYLVSLNSGDIYYHSAVISQLFPTHLTGAADMSGVGNTIIAVAGLGLTLGLRGEAIAELSNIAAAIVAQYSGVVSLSRDLFLKEVSESQLLEKYL